MSDDSIYRHVGDDLDTEPEPVQRGRNVIVVIGIDDYKWNPLKNAVNDARSMQQLFADVDFNNELVESLYNEQATLAAINALVRDQLSSLLTDDDSLVLFFAGHGYTDKKQVGGKPDEIGYIIPVDAPHPNERKFSKYIKLESFLGDLDELPARHILVILDSCFSGHALDFGVRKRAGEIFNPKLNLKISRRLLTATLDDESALDSGRTTGHSLFTGEFIRAIEDSQAEQGNKGYITTYELGVFIRDRVIKNSSRQQQIPDFGAFGRDEGGEMFIPLADKNVVRRKAGDFLGFGDAIYKLGQMTGDPEQYLSAERQYAIAQRYLESMKAAPEQAILGRAKALIILEKFDEVINILNHLKIESDDSAAERAVYLGMAYAQRGDYENCVGLLQDERIGSLTRNGWVNEYINLLHPNYDELGGLLELQKEQNSALSDRRNRLKEQNSALLDQRDRLNEEINKSIKQLSAMQGKDVGGDEIVERLTKKIDDEAKKIDDEAKKIDDENRKLIGLQQVINRKKGEAEKRVLQPLTKLYISLQQFSCPNYEVVNCF